MVSLKTDPSSKMSVMTRSNLSAQQELTLVVAAGSSHPPVDVAANDAAEVYLSQTVKRFAPLSPVDGSKDAWSLHSSSNSSLPQSVSVSRLGPTHSGVFTGRSSVTSWEIDDEFDQALRHNVQQTLDQLFGALYQEGGVGEGNEELEEECLQWGEAFPHLRLIGQQLCREQSDGTEEVMVDTPPATAEPRPRVQTQGETTALTDYKSLSVKGRHLHPVAVYCSHKELSDECSVVEEEVIAAHGVVEEFIVFDNMEEEQHLLSYSKSRRRNHRHLGVPPVTPIACVRDTVCSQVFDQIWAEIVTVLRPLLQNENLMDRCQSFIRSQDGSDLEAMPPLVPSTALPHMFPGLRDRPTLMRATGQFGSQPLRPRPAPLPMLNRDYSSPKTTELQEVMKIRSLPLQKRLSSTLNMDSSSPSELWDTRAETSTFAFRSRIQAATPLSVRLSDLQMGAMQGHPTPISSKGRRNVQLKPLEKPKTPALPMDDLIKDFGGLRGQKLSMHGDFGSSPPGGVQSPLPWARNTQLPPLEDPSEKRSPPPPRGSAYKNRVVTFASRVSSAAAGNRSNTDMQKPLPVLLNDPRPSTTTSSFRTETPKSVSRRGSNQSVSNSALSQTPKVASGVLGVGIIGHAAGIYNELRERFEDEEEIIFEENDDELRAEEVGQHPFWKGPVYMSPPWSTKRAKRIGMLKYRGPVR